MNDITASAADLSNVGAELEPPMDDLSRRAKAVAGETGIPIGFLVAAVSRLRRLGNTNLRRGMVVTEAKRIWIDAISGPARHFRRTNPEYAKLIEREIALVKAGKYAEAVKVGGTP